MEVIRISPAACNFVKNVCFIPGFLVSPTLLSVLPLKEGHSCLGAIGGVGKLHHCITLYTHQTHQPVRDR